VLEKTFSPTILQNNNPTTACSGTIRWSFSHKDSAKVSVLFKLWDSIPQEQTGARWEERRTGLPIPCAVQIDRHPLLRSLFPTFRSLRRDFLEDQESLVLHVSLKFWMSFHETPVYCWVNLFSYKAGFHATDAIFSIQKAIFQTAEYGD